MARQIHQQMYAGGIATAETTKLYQQYFDRIKRAAYLGHLEALYDLGQQYEDIGFLGIPNPMYQPKKCVYWYTKASAKGHAEACNNLAALYEKGEGCSKDLETALAMFRRSSELGSPNGKKNYRIMRRQLVKVNK